MNHVYRIVWNHATACYQAVTESAVGPGKGSGKSRVKRGTAAVSAALCIVSLPSFAGPSGGQVTAGSAAITQSGTATTINQTSNKAAIDWTKFSVGANESVRFNQPSASALTLNRVTGTESSAILGKLSANGQVFILNPNGVLFGAGSQVNVGGLTASTLRLDNANFMAGNYKFAGDASGSVVNNGTIAVAPGGTIALMAPLVQNTGTLSAPAGSVLLTGAQGVTLNLQADGGLVAYTLDNGSAQALVDNGGLIEAGGGHVVLTAKGVDALSKAVVNHSGVIEAQTVANKGGVIELLSDMQSGSVIASGKLDASAPNGGDGGFVETSASNVKIADTATVTTAAAAGQTGMWLLDPTDFTIYASGSSPTPSSGVAAATLSASLAITNATIATSAAGAGNGDIFVNSAVNWSANRLTLSAHRNININADLNGSGTAKLALEYGQVTASGADSDYILGNGAKVNLPAGQNFSTKQGSTSTIENYIVITTLGAEGSVTGTDLQGMNGNVNINYVLGADIDASSTAAWGGGAGFWPIWNGGVYSTTNRYPTGYTGSFDGLNHVISNLTIDSTKVITDISRPIRYVNVGLFDSLSGSVKNVSLESINFNASMDNYSYYANAGGIAGNNSGTISNVAVSGRISALSAGGVSVSNTSGCSGCGTGGGVKNARSTVTIIGSAVGGISKHGGEIKNSSYSGDLIGIGQGARIGGIFSEGGVVDGSFSEGTITGPSLGTYGSYGGGIGTLGGQISNSYSTMKISGFNYTSGIIGGGYSSVKNSYFAGEMTYTPLMVNGVDHGRINGISHNLVNGASAVVSSYWDKQKAGTTLSEGGTGKTTAEMQQQATYAGWDFVNTWRMVEGSSYPLLRALTQGTITLNVTASNARKTYDGNAINTLADLQALPGGFSVTAGNTLANGDTLPALNVAGTGIWSGTLNVNGAGNTWVGARDAGTYAIVPSGLSSQKYAIVYINGALTIDPATLTAVGVSGSRVYDGTRLANWNDNTQLIGVLSGDQGNVSLTSGAGVLASKNVGAQTLISLGTLALSGTAAGNYQLGTTGSSWMIQPRPVDISVRKTYDTNSTFSSGFVITSGLVGGDAVPAISGTATTSSSNAGQYISFNSNQLASSDPNYTANPLGAVVAIIDPAPLTAVGVSGSRDYDGTRVANWNDNTQLIGVLSGDQGNVSLTSGAGELASKNAGVQPLISLGTLALGGKAAGNYQLGTTGSSWIIQPRPVTITGSQTYNGTTVAEWSGNTYSLQGILPADKGLVKMASGVTELSSPNVGTHLLSSLGSLALGGTEAANYTLVADRSGWIITPASLVVAPSFTSQTYFYGDTHAKGSSVKIVEGRLFKDDALLIPPHHDLITFQDGNVGNNKVLTINRNILVDDNNSGSNYFVTMQDGRGDIVPLPVYITVSKPFDGNANFTSGFEVTNKGPDNVVITGTATVSSTAGKFKDFKSHTLKSSNPNFTASQLEGVDAVIDDFKNPIIIGYLTYVSHGLEIGEYDESPLGDRSVGRVTNGAAPVYYNDILQMSKGEATITFNDGSTLNLAPDTNLQLSPGAMGGSTAEKILNDGRLWGRILSATGVNLGGGGLVNGVRG